MIEQYDFGKIVVDGKEYPKDVIVYPDTVKFRWWRKRAHEVLPEDIEEVFQKGLEVLIIGTGYLGRLRIPQETKIYVESKGIELILEDTTKACEKYNELAKSGKIVVAAMHVTC